MLLINARAGISAIHGIGLIAREYITRGTRCWAFQPGFDVILSVEQMANLSDAARAQAMHYSWFDPAQGAYVLTGDDDRFTNHSDDPNTRSDGPYTVAVRDIQPGEEITFDYRELGGTEHVGWEARPTAMAAVR